MLSEPDLELLIAYGKVSYWWNEVLKYEKLKDFDNWSIAIRNWKESQANLAKISKKFDHTFYMDMKQRTGNLMVTKNG